MKYTAQFKKKLVKDIQDGTITMAEAHKKYKCSLAAMRGWKKKYGEVTEVVEEAPRVERRERISLTDQDKLILSKKDPEFVYRGVVEDERRLGRVEQFKEAGWEPCTAAEGRRLASLSKGADPGSTLSQTAGAGAKVYFMKKRRDWEEEDLKRLENRARAEEDAIFGELNKEGRFGQIKIGGRSEERKPG